MVLPPVGEADPRQMSTQQSNLPIHANAKHTTRSSIARKNTLDPYAAPAAYYGQSHNPRQIAKSRTYSAVDNTTHAIVGNGVITKERRLSHGMSHPGYTIHLHRTLQSNMLMHICMQMPRVMPLVAT